MSAIYFVSFLYFLLINFHSSLCDPAFKKCESECVGVPMVSGPLILPVESGKNCCWIVQLNTVPSDRVESFLFLETINFASGDYLTIFSSDYHNETSLLANITESLSNNLFFTGTKVNLIIKLFTSDTISWERSFRLFLESRRNEISIPIADDTIIKLLSTSSKPQVENVNWKFEFALSPKQKSKKLVASVVDKSNGIVVKFDKVWSSDSPDYLSQNDKIQFGLMIQDISSKNNLLVISVYSVTDACSSNVVLSISEPKTTVAVKSEDLKNLNYAKCLWIIESGHPYVWLNIDYDTNSIDIKEGNSFVVRKGNRRSSPVLFGISSTNFDEIRANVYNSIFNFTALYITYEIFEAHGEHPHFDVFRPKSNNYIFLNTDVHFAPTMDKKFILKAEKDSKGALYAPWPGSFPWPEQRFSNTTYIYDKPVLSPDNLLAVFNAGDILPDSIWSDTDVFVIVFTTPPEMVVLFRNQPCEVFASTARQSKGSLVLFGNQLDCNSSYNWFIPPRHTVPNEDYQIVKSLVISDLALEKGDSMSITSFVPGMKPQEFTITGENAMSLPTFYLDANISHNIKYERADKCNKNPITLIQASIDTISYDACANIEVNAKRDFVSCNYPNNYPLTEWTITRNCRHMNSTSSNIYISFVDVDLANNHSLEFLGSTGTINITQSKIPGDTIVPNKVAINFNRVFNSDKKTVRSLGDKFSGRGFKATLEPIECGGVYVNKFGPLSINGTDKPEKCIWIIQTPIEDSETIKFLNFTLSDGLKDAIVYDSNSRKDGRTLNITGAGYYNSTTETIIIEFTSSSNPVQINWSTMVCTDRCLGVRRCINPSERCNGVNDCGDWSDELHCNDTASAPPRPKIAKSGDEKYSSFPCTLSARIMSRCCKMHSLNAKTPLLQFKNTQTLMDYCFRSF